MNPLQKLKQFFINLISSKSNKITSSNKISQRVSSDLQIKQVERKQQQKTVTSQISISVTEFSPTVNRHASVKHISELPSGYLWDTCSLMNTEDYLEILQYGYAIINKLHNKPMYILTLSENEYANKKCPKDHDEKIINRGFTGKPREFHRTLVELSKSLQVPIYLVKVENSLEIKQLEKKLLQELRYTDLHRGDSTFLAFAQLTKSILITSDTRLLLSSRQAHCQKPINFQEFLEELMQPSPITVVLRERRKLNKKQQSRRNQ